MTGRPIYLFHLSTVLHISRHPTTANCAILARYKPVSSVAEYSTANSILYTGWLYLRHWGCPLRMNEILYHSVFPGGFRVLDYIIFICIFICESGCYTLTDVGNMITIVCECILSFQLLSTAFQ